MRRAVGLCIGALLVAREAHADPAFHARWGVADGLPVDGVSDLLVDRAGFVWVATWDGLVRYDGARFAQIEPDGQRWPSRRLVALREASDGAIFVQTEPGAFVRVDADGRLRSYDAGPTRGSAAMLVDGTGCLVSTETGLHRLEGATVVDIDPARFAADRPTDLTRDGNGQIWAITASGKLYQVGDASIPWAVTGGPTNPRTIRAAPDGTWWIGAADGLYRLVGHDATRVGDWAPAVRNLQPLADGAWVGTRDGLFRWRDGVAEPMAPDDPTRTPDHEFFATDALGHTWVASGHVVLRDGEIAGRIDEGRITDLAVDRFGTAWLGTSAGLHQLVPPRITTVGRPEGLSEASVYAVAADTDGSWWVGSAGAGVDRVDGASVQHFGAEAGLSSDVRAALRARSGALWIGTGRDGLFRQEGDRFVADGPKGSVQALFERRDGTIVAGAADGAWVRRDGAWSKLPEIPGLARVFAEDDGGLWVGTATAGVWRVTGDGAARVDVGSSIIRALLPDGLGGVWAGTEDFGLRHSAGHGFGVDDGLPGRTVHTLVDDGRGAVWGSTNRGLFRIDAGALRDRATGSSKPRIAVFGERDGMRNPEANGGTGHASVRLADGRLLFTTQAGIAVVDPAEIAATSVPPPMALVALDVGAGPFALPPTITLPAAQRSFGIDLGVLALRDPAGAVAEWRLDGVDADWVRGGDRRTAWYTDVGPGTYTFHLRGAAADGTAAATEASAQITVLPWFWETWPFRAAVALAAVGAIGLAVWLRLETLRRRQRELEAIVAARTAALAAKNAALIESQAVVEAQAARIAELDRRKTSWFTGLSHELRTPLTLVIAPLQDVRDGRHGPLAPGVLTAVTRAEKSAEGILEIVNQLLDVARIDAGGLALRREIYDLAELTRTAAAEFAALAERQGIRFVADVPPGPVVADIDVREFRKVLGNLLSNAIKFTPTGGELRVSLTPAVTLTVADTGIGISADGITRVFDRFYTADGATSGLQAGTGLGLALCREIVELHGGTLTVTSALGQGSTFTVTLPPTVARPVIPEVSAGAPDERTTVLVVDDHEDLRRYLREVLSPRYRVTEAADGLEALALARRDPPDVVVTDVIMPGMHGHDLVRALRADPETATVPIVVLSSRGAAESQIEGLTRGADVYLVKPLSSAVLRAQVDGLVAGRARLLEQIGAPAPIAETLSADDRYLQAVRDLIAERHVDPDFGVQELADAMHQDRAHLFRRLKALTDQAPSDLLRVARLEHAARLLARRAGNVSEIAYTAGFASVSYFSTAFREHFGVPPSRYSVPGDTTR